MRILLSSPITPYPSFKGGRDSLHHNYSNTTYGQDIFAIPLYTHFLGLHLIAQNISAKTTLLENPSAKDFAQEVQKQYDIVGIYFVIPFFSKALEMCKIVHKYSSQSKIALGGPGVQCLSHPTGKEEELSGLVNYVCRGEGISFLRKLLGETEDRPVTQDLPLGTVVPFRCKFFSRYSLAIISALGCTNSCEFCSTSSFFGHRRIQLATPRELLEIIRSYIERYNISSARILDDNLLENKKYVKELAYLMRNDPLCQERKFKYSTFANLSTIVKYEPEELVEYGVSGLLIGVESKFVSKLYPNIKKKLENIDIKEVFQNLQDHGIFVEGSMILGWDFHDKQNIVEDIEFYVSLRATLDQIVCLIAVPETKLWEMFKREGRLSDKISWDDGGFYTMWHNYKNFGNEELWRYEDYALRKSFETWGPSYLRLFDVHMRGYRKFKYHHDPFFRRIAESHKEGCKTLYPLLLCIKMFAPSERVKRITENLEESFIQEFGTPAIKEKLQSLAVALIASFRKVENKLIKEDTFQPKCKIYHYN